MFTASFDFGASFRFKISEKAQLYSDIGAAFTILEWGDFETNDSLSYWSAGIYVGPALQLSLSKTLYLEFGLISIFHAFSSQKGVAQINNRQIEYDDTGRWDMISSSVYINIGWRFFL